MRVMKIDDDNHLCPICGQSIMDVVNQSELFTLSDGTHAHKSCEEYYKKYLESGASVCIDGSSYPPITGTAHCCGDGR